MDADDLEIAREDLQDFVLLVKRESSQLVDIRDGLLGIREVLHACHRPHQLVLARLGLIDWLVDFVRLEKSCHVSLLAFGVLGDMCLFNDEVSGEVGKNSLLKSVVEKVIHDPKALSSTKQIALRSLNIAADSWETHPYLSSLIPQLVHILNTSNDTNLMRIAVMFLGKFAYNEEMHSALEAANAVAPLYTVSQSTNQQLLPVAATLAVVNLTKGALTITKDSVQELVEAFRTTLNHMPYPPGSRFFGTPWKIAMGLSNLCRNKQNAQDCLECGCMSLVCYALKSTCESNNSNDFVNDGRRRQQQQQQQAAAHNANPNHNHLQQNNNNNNNNDNNRDIGFGVGGMVNPRLTKYALLTLWHSAAHHQSI